jgi:hypothetical protein
MNVITHDDTSVTLDTGLIQTRRVKNPKHVAARLSILGVEYKPAIQARRVFDAVCKFYATMQRLAIVLVADQQVKHDIHLKGITVSRIGVYQGGAIYWAGNKYTSLSAFAHHHYKDVHPTRTTANGWLECKTLVQGQWIKMMDLRETFLKN